MSDYKSSDFTPSAFNPHIKVVFSNYYPEITDNLIKSIKLAIQEHKKEYAPYNLTLTDHTEFHEVSGVWEIPYTINTYADSTKYFIAVGVVVKGETDHYEYISNSVSNALMNITISKNVYISNCILNLHNIEQAEDRSKTKGIEAVDALLNIINTFKM